MTRALKYVVIMVMLFPAAVYSTAREPEGNAYSVLSYRCEIIGRYADLSEISEGFGTVLLSEDYENIFLTSVAVVESLDEMKRGLESADVPEELREAHNLVLKSVESYRRSADLIRVAIGTYLGVYEPTGTDIQKLIDLSEQHVITANEYLGRSLALHEDLFEAHAAGPNECRKYVAGNY